MILPHDLLDSTPTVCARARWIGNLLNVCNRNACSASARSWRESQNAAVSCCRRHDDSQNTMAMDFFSLWALYTTRIPYHTGSTSYENVPATVVRRTYTVVGCTKECCNNSTLVLGIILINLEASLLDYKISALSCQLPADVDVRGHCSSVSPTPTGLLLVLVYQVLLLAHATYLPIR